MQQSFRERCFTRNAVLAVRRIVSERPRRRIAMDEANQDLSGIYVDAAGHKHQLFFWYPGHPLRDADEKALERLTGILQEARSLCASQGVRFCVVFLPTKFRVHGEFTHFRGDARPLEWVRNDLPDRLAAIVRSQFPGTGFLDLTPALTRQAQSGALVYQTYDSHWSSEGHRVAATAIAEFLHEWLEADDPLWNEHGSDEAQGRPSR